MLLWQGTTLPTCCCLSACEICKFTFMLEFKSDIIKSVSSAKMSHSISVIEVLLKHTFYAFSSFLFLFMWSQGHVLSQVVNGIDMYALASITSYLDACWSWADCHVGNYIFWTDIVTNSASWIWYSFFVSLSFKIVSTLFFLFPGKANGHCECF